jgi:hypothetical protein
MRHFLYVRLRLCTLTFSSRWFRGGSKSPCIHKHGCQHCPNLPSDLSINCSRAPRTTQCGTQTCTGSAAAFTRVAVRPSSSNIVSEGAAAPRNERWYSARTADNCRSGALVGPPGTGRGRQGWRPRRAPQRLSARPLSKGVRATISRRARASQKESPFGRGGRMAATPVYPSQAWNP